MWPQRIEKLRIQGFKTFADAEVELRSCNILIGGNGAGKSSLLSVLKMLRSLGLGELQHYVAKSGGANDLLRRAIPPTSDLELYLELVTITGKSQYRLFLNRTENDRLLIRFLHIDRFEFDSTPSGGERHLREPVQGLELKPAEMSTGEPKLFTGLRVFHFAETAIASPASFECDLDDNQELREDGRNLAAFLYLLEQRQSTAYRRITNIVGQVLSGFGGFILQPSALNPNRIRLRWRMKGTEGDFGPHQLSDGTMRFILLATLLHQPAEMLPKIIAIDEPELGLHPAALNLVASLIRVAAHHCQMIVATQSAALVDEFEADDVIVVHQHEHGSKLERLSSELLQEWLAEYSLGELWEKNVVGGGPHS
jgi:predicted ATPase